MSFWFVALNSKPMEGLLVGVLRCCEFENLF